MAQSGCSGWFKVSYLKPHSTYWHMNRQPIQDFTPIFSFLDAMYDMVNSNSVILYAGGIFMVAFVCSVMGKFNALEQRVIFRKKSHWNKLSVHHFLYASQIVLSFCGLMVIGLSVLSCFGVCFYFKLYSTQMQQMVPFLLLGIGVDDIFVIAKVWYH